ncbi:MAG: DUF177 domain-containing protein [Candidatus Omnitrophota bacterium]
MKIDPRQIPPEGFSLSEEYNPLVLDLDTEIIKFRAPLKVKAEVSKVSDNIFVYLSINAKAVLFCGRCLEEFTIGLTKFAELNYPIDSTMQKIDLDPDIREEIILDYPIKPLCKPDCLGFCQKCGVNLNNEECKCAI